MMPDVINVRPRPCIFKSRTIWKKCRRIKIPICRPIHTPRQMSMTAIVKSDFHVCGLKINNENRTIEETVTPDDCDTTKLSRKLLSCLIASTVRAIRVLMIIMIIKSSKTFLKFNQYLNINSVSYRSCIIILPVWKDSKLCARITYLWKLRSKITGAGKIRSPDATCPCLRLLYHKSS